MLFFFVLIISVILFIALKKLAKICDAENRVDWGRGFLNRLDGLNRLFCHRYHHLPKEYIDLPEHGPAIVVANHVSGLDPLLLAVICKRPVRFLVAREEYSRFGFQWLFKAAGCIPVDRQGNPERALHEALVKLNQGEVLGIFPHGGIHWPTNLTAKIKGGAVRLAQRKQCLIYPVYFDGIRLKGLTIPALLVRSQATMKPYPPIACDNKSYDECMEQLAQILNQNPNKLN